MWKIIKNCTKNVGKQYAVVEKIYHILYFKSDYFVSKIISLFIFWYLYEMYANNVKLEFIYKIIRRI